MNKTVKKGYAKRMVKNKNTMTPLTKLILCLAVLAGMFACKAKPGNAQVASNDSIEVIGNDTIWRNEYFSDSLHIGKAGRNKVELARYIGEDSVWVVIRFYAKSKNNRWVQKQEFRYEKDLISECDAQVSDFNNDGNGDFTYVSSTAARGANEVRRLFIYNKTADRLIYIKNSEEYPNLQYNKELDCLDAFLVYGGCSTVFLKLEADSLRKFAEVELFDERLTVAEYDKSGNKKILKDQAMKDENIRYINYNPLKEE